MPRIEGFDHTHATWTAVLGQYVKDGRVDYRGLKAQPEKNRGRLQPWTKGVFKRDLGWRR